MNEDELAKLLPIVAELTRKYTSAESTSVTYEKANQLMGAVLYCIKEYENSGRNSECVEDTLSQKEKYLLGKELVHQKMIAAKNLYNEWIVDFDFYGNINYQETVRNAIPGFFIYYDAVFEPQNNIITYDYKTLISVLDSEDTGVDLMYRYLSYIKTEQDFLAKLGRENVISILRRYDDAYETQYYNLASVILRHLLICMLIRKKEKVPASDEDYLKVYEMIRTISQKELEQVFCNLLKDFVKQFYEGNEKMYVYLCNDISEFTIQLKNVEEAEYIRNVVIL